MTEIEHYMELVAQVRSDLEQWRGAAQELERRVRPHNEVVFDGARYRVEPAPELWAGAPRQAVLVRVQREDESAER